MQRLRRALQIYARTTFSWDTAWRLAGEHNPPPTIDAPYRAEEREDGFEYVVPVARPQ